MRHSTHLSERAAHQAVEWAAAEGWNPGRDDAERFLRADPDAFFASETDGEVSGTVSCVLYGDDYAFIGFYIVRADLRGRGIGTELFDRALARAGDRVIGLDGVLEQQQVYASLGFDVAHRNERWRGTGGGDAGDDLVSLADIPFEALADYDARVFGAERERFLHVWMERPAGHALAFLEDGDVAGYAVLRPCREGMKIGALFADDRRVASALLDGMRSAAGAGTTVFLDVPHANPAALELARANLDAPVFETARMYCNGRPPEDLARVFGVTTFELG
jgi:ribosomal protein S18 acetylase RimI-like enzyme